jgi:hypothetical protein
MNSVETPRTPAQSYAVIAGIFLVALGVLSLIFGNAAFSTVSATNPADFLIWNTTGWTDVMWIALGGLGLMAMVRVDASRTYAMAAGLFFALIAVWGFIDGSDVFTLFVANPVNNITHAVLAVLGLAVALPSERAQRSVAPGGSHGPHDMSHPGSAGHA